MRVIFALPLAAADALSTDAGRYGHQCVAIVGDAATLAATAAGLPADLAVVAARPELLTEATLSACDAHGIRIIALAENDAGRQLASRLGLYDVLPETTQWSAIEVALTSPPTVVPGPSEGRGLVVAVWGPAGAPGRTSVAIGIAAELAAAGRSVALGDVDTHGAAIAPTLGMLDEAPGFAAACRLAGSSSLDRAELERIAQRYGSGQGSFWVLTGIARQSRWPELSADRVRGTIEECRAWVDVTVLDTGFSVETDEEISSDLFAPRRNGATIAALREADVVVAVGAADPVGLARFLRSYGDLLETCDGARVQVVMNKLRASAIGLNPSGQVRQTLARFGGIEDAVLIPFDGSAHDTAILSGRTVLDVAPKSPARVALRGLAASLLNAPALISDPVGPR